MWQEEGFGLGLDVVMKEGYAGLIGASSPTFKGTPKTMKACESRPPSPLLSVVVVVVVVGVCMRSPLPADRLAMIA